MKPIQELLADNHALTRLGPFLLQGGEFSMSQAGRVVTAIAGLLLLAIPLSAGVQHLPPVVCPDFSRREPATSKVTVDIAEALKPSGVVCMRIQNEGKRTIQIEPGGAVADTRENRQEAAVPRL